MLHLSIHFADGKLKSHDQDPTGRKGQNQDLT